MLPSCMNSKPRPRQATAVAPASPFPPSYLLLFLSFTNAPSRNLFPFTSLQMPGGCTPRTLSSRIKMSQNHANSNSTNDSCLPRPVPTRSGASREGRCEHRFLNGTRCRLFVPNAESLFCRTHAQLPEHEHAPVDLSATLTVGLTEFKSAVPINEFLSRLLHLQAQDRISPRRAAVMAYTCNLILRTLPAIEHETNPQNEEQQWIMDLPGPRRDAPIPPSHPVMDWLNRAPDILTSKEPSCLP